MNNKVKFSKLLMNLEGTEATKSHIIKHLCDEKTFYDAIENGYLRISRKNMYNEDLFTASEKGKTMFD